MFGFCFDEDEEANALYREVTRCTASPTAKATKSSVNLAKQKEQPKPKKTFTLQSLKLDRSTISPPKLSSFLHVSHVGFDSKGAVQASKDVDPAWGTVLQGSRGSGPIQEVTINDMNPVEGLVDSPVEQYPTNEAMADISLPNVADTVASRSSVESRPAIPAIPVPEATAEPDKPTPDKRGLFRRKTGQSVKSLK